VVVPVAVYVVWVNVAQTDVVVTVAVPPLPCAVVVIVETDWLVTVTVVPESVTVDAERVFVVVERLVAVVVLPGAVVVLVIVEVLVWQHDTDVLTFVVVSMEVFVVVCVSKTVVVLEIVFVVVVAAFGEISTDELSVFANLTALTPTAVLYTKNTTSKVTMI
jgi:hypothetical protein